MGTVARKKVFNRGGGVCYLCGRVTVFPGVNMSPTQATIDHVWPKCRYSQDNRQGAKGKRLACFECNLDKGDWTFTELLLGFKLN